MIHLNTRSKCDACGEDAFLETDAGAFVCSNCAESFIEFDILIPSALSSPDANASLANPTPGPASGATLSVSDGDSCGSLPSGEIEPLVTLAWAPSESNSRIPCGTRDRAHGPGPSSITGMSDDRSNAGGEHEEVAPLPISTSEAPAICEITSLIVAGANIDRSLTGTGPGASGPERDIFGVTNSDPVAKATEGKSGTAGIKGPVRRSTTGTGLQVGEADADRSATSEIMDATAGETATNSGSSVTADGEVSAVAGAPTIPVRPDDGLHAGKIAPVSNPALIDNSNSGDGLGSLLPPASETAAEASVSPPFSSIIGCPLCGLSDCNWKHGPHDLDFIVRNKTASRSRAFSPISDSFVQVSSSDISESKSVAVSN